MAAVSTTHILGSDVIGLQGQNLGSTEELIIDTTAGVVTHVVLSTVWQRITIPWTAVRFNAEEHTLKIRSQPRSQA